MTLLDNDNLCREKHFQSISHECLSNDIMFRYKPIPSDVDNVKELVGNTGFFNEEEIEVAGELVQEYLDKGEKSGYYFVFAAINKISSKEENFSGRKENCTNIEENFSGREKKCTDTEDNSKCIEDNSKKDEILGYGCYGHISGTESSYDIYWIAVQPELQKKGLGKTILNKMEQLIKISGGTRIYVETSMQQKYITTRKFYEKCSYKLETVLEHFYSPDDGKAIYCKADLI